MPVLYLEAFGCSCRVRLEIHPGDRSCEVNYERIGFDRIGWDGMGWDEGIGLVSLVWVLPLGIGHEK